MKGIRLIASIKTVGTVTRNTIDMYHIDDMYEEEVALPQLLM